MAYPGATSNVKTYIWKSVCMPVLMSGTECTCTSVNNNNIKWLDIVQDNLLRQAMGLGQNVFWHLIYDNLEIFYLCTKEFLTFCHLS